MKVMFAPGNGTERMRFSTIKINKPENVIDMFTGLGYFTIPFSRTNYEFIQMYYAIEKNPDSHYYLLQNLKINGLSKKVTAVCGDNREAVPEMLGKADRILMGYLPNTKDYIPRYRNSIC